MRAEMASPGVVSRAELPHPGRYEIDPAHSVVGFVAHHLVVAKVRGRFLAFSGTITVEDPIERSHVEVEIDADSVATGVAARDVHLRSADFFDAETHPLITFRSTSVTAHGDGSGTVEGDLTVRATTHPVTLGVVSLGSRPLLTGEEAVILRATAEVEREDLGLVWDAVAPTGGLLIGHTVEIDLFVQATPSAP